ncbi:argininosuccinate lyase [Aggregatilinea lenta]|uniref:argininosuccinate lyase n=1 Tax=Aggregatilinea lenta TaxID=913108 RepID=UPI000E5BB3E8|nr:argininosuccinate lyase [Aggregatilinea lenta]
MTLWGGAFSQPTDDAVRRLNDSLRFDWRLYDVDISGSIAWAHALAGAGVITEDEYAALADGLERVRAEFAGGTFEAASGDEDIHTAVERRLGALVGDVAGKLHTGRSRNDQVATDVLLWLIRAQKDVRAAILPLATALRGQAQRGRDAVMPGYTHFQPAQPITAAHWWLSHFWPLTRDIERLAEQADRWRDKCPLGSGALAGTPYAINRQRLAERLGFRRATANSLDGVADRDHVAEFLFALTLLGVHLSRLAEDLIVYANPALGFVRLDERYSTGSSLMPQKRNPDPLELARGKAGRAIGNLTGFLATLKGLPTAYNKDLQEDKEPLFDAYDTIMALLPPLVGLIETIRINPDRMEAALDESMLATDLADYLVERGVPFRQAHVMAGRVVRAAEERGVPLSGVPLDALREISEHFTEDVSAVFDFRAAAARRKAPGGTGDYDGQMRRAEAWLATQKA